jgi:hypothetical protein
MQTVAVNNLGLLDSLSFQRAAGLEMRVSHAGLWQRIADTLIRGVHTERSLTDIEIKLTFLAEHAYSARQLDVVGHVGQLLSRLPLSLQTESIGLYYQALNLNRGGRGDTILAGSLLEKVADRACSKYVARAMVALGINAVALADYHTALSCYREATQILTSDRILDPVTFYMTRRMTAVVKGMTGDHRGAVADLEKMFPLARLASLQQPYAYYDYMNTLAVELGEVGRLEQARRASGITLASPFASAYPEWLETFEEIRLKQRRASRSIVSVPHSIGETKRLLRYVGKRHKLMNFPAPESVNLGAPDQPSGDSPARVLDFQEWKTVLRGSNNSLTTGLAPQVRQRMTPGEKLIRLMDLISQDETDDEMVDRILEAVEQIVLNRRSENPN